MTERIQKLPNRAKAGQAARICADKRARQRTVRRVAHENIPVGEEIALSKAEHGRPDFAGGFRVDTGKLLLQFRFIIKLVEHQRGQRRAFFLTGFSHIAHLLIACCPDDSMCFAARQAAGRGGVSNTRAKGDYSLFIVTIYARNRAISLEMRAVQC